MINKTDVGTKFDLVLSALIWRALVNNFDILHQKESFFDSNDFQIQVSPSNHFVISHPMSVIPPPPFTFLLLSVKNSSIFPSHNSVSAQRAPSNVKQQLSNNFYYSFPVPFISHYSIFPALYNMDRCCNGTEVSAQSAQSHTKQPLSNNFLYYFQSYRPVPAESHCRLSQITFHSIFLTFLLILESPYTIFPRPFPFLLALGVDR